MATGVAPAAAPVPAPPFAAPPPGYWTATATEPLQPAAIAAAPPADAAEQPPHAERRMPASSPTLADIGTRRFSLFRVTGCYYKPSRSRPMRCHRSALQPEEAHVQNASVDAVDFRPCRTTSSCQAKKRRSHFLLQAKRSDSDASHDLSDSHREDRNSDPFTRVGHCAVDTSGAPGGGVPCARLDDGVATFIAVCADECAVGSRLPPVHWRQESYWQRLVDSPGITVFCPP